MTHLGDARTVKYPVGKGHYGREQNYAPIEPPFGMTVREWANRLGIMNPKVAPTGIESDNPADFAEVTQRITMANRAYDRASRLRARGTFPNAKFYIDEGRTETPVESLSEAEKIIYEGLRLDIPGMSLDEKRQKRASAISGWGGGNNNLQAMVLQTHTEGRPTENDLGTWDDRSTPGMDAQTTGPSTFDKWMGLDDSPSTTGMTGPSTAGPGAAPSGTDTPPGELQMFSMPEINAMASSGQFPWLAKKDDAVKTWATKPEAEAAARAAGELNFVTQHVDKEVKDKQGNITTVREYTWNEVTDPGQIQAQAAIKGKYSFVPIPGSKALGQQMFQVIGENGIVIETVKVPERLTERDINVIEEPFENDPTKMHVTVLAGGKIQDTFTYDIEKPVKLFASYEEAMNAGFAQDIPSSRIEIKSSLIDGKIQYYPTVGAMKYRPGIVTERELGGTGDRTFFRTEDGEFSELERTFEPGVYRDPASGRQYQQNPDGSIKVLDREYQPGLVQTGPYTAFQQPTGQLSEVARRFEPGFITDAQGRELIQQPTGAVSQPRPVNMEEIITQALVDGDWDKALAFEDFKNRPTAMEAFQAALNFARSPADQQLISSIARGEVTVDPPPAGTIRRVGPQPDFLVEEYNTFQQRLRGGRPPTPAEQAQYMQRHMAGESPLTDQLQLTIQQKDREIAQAQEAAEALAGSYNEQLQALEGQMQEAFQTSFTPLGQELGVETPQWESVLADYMAEQTAQTGQAKSAVTQGVTSYTRMREDLQAQVEKGTRTQQQADASMARMLASGYVSPITEGESELFNITMQDYAPGGQYGADAEFTPIGTAVSLDDAKDWIARYYPDVDINDPAISQRMVALAQQGSGASYRELVDIAQGMSEFPDPAVAPTEEVAAPKESQALIDLRNRMNQMQQELTKTTGQLSARQEADKKQREWQQTRDRNKALQDAADKTRRAQERRDLQEQFDPSPSFSRSTAGFAPSIDGDDDRAYRGGFAPLSRSTTPSIVSGMQEVPTRTPSLGTARTSAPSGSVSFGGQKLGGLTGAAERSTMGGGPGRNPIRGMAGGGMAMGNDLELVGERGPELVDLPPGSFVLPLKHLNRNEMVGLQQRGVPGYAGGGVVFGSQTLPLGIRQLQAGRQITPSRGYLSQQAGLTIPSAQAFQNLTPESRDIFRDTAMQAGIPARAFEQELALARPGGRRLPLARTLPVTRRGIR